MSDLKLETSKFYPKKSLAYYTYRLGCGIQYGANIGLFAMAVIGTVSIDLVLIATLLKGSSNSSSSSSFLTGYLFGRCFSCNCHSNSLLTLCFSPITTAIAVGLSIYFGVPMVGTALVLGWTVVAAALLFGLALKKLAEALESQVDSCNNFTDGNRFSSVA